MILFPIIVFDGWGLAYSILNFVMIENVMQNEVMRGNYEKCDVGSCAGYCSSSCSCE